MRSLNPPLGASSPGSAEGELCTLRLSGKLEISKHSDVPIGHRGIKR